MAGTCLIAYGVVFVLLIGEIDLSVAFVSGVAGVVVAEAAAADRRRPPGWLCILLALPARRAIGAFQGSIVALIGVPSFVVTLAGLLIWQGVILRSSSRGVIVIQDHTINDFSSYFFTRDSGGLDPRRSSSASRTSAGRSGARSPAAARDPDPRPGLLVAEVRGRAGDRVRDRRRS